MAGQLVRSPVAADKHSGTRNQPRPRRRTSAAGILACLLALAVGCTPQTPPGPSLTPTASAPPSSATPSPTPTPTPTSARDRALADSKQAYIDYWAARDRMAQSGGASEIPSDLNRYLDPEGPAHTFYEQEVKSLKSAGFKREGFAVLRNLRILDLGELDVATPEAQWQACVDQSGVRVTKGGKPFEHAKYLEEEVRLRLDKESRQWRIFLFTIRELPAGKNCNKV